MAQSETSRIEAFSDGVFAIAITLLILEIKMPGRDKPLAVELEQQWPAFLAYVISFAFISVMWINHHRLFNHIRRADNGLLILNSLLLLGVTFVPYPTAVLATFLHTADERTALLFYNGVYLAIAFFFNALWMYGRARGLVPLQAHESGLNITRQYAVGPVFYGICMALAFVSVKWCLILNVALAIYFAMPPEWFVRRTHNHGSI